MADDLEGKYFAFEFSADYTDENGALAILQMNKGRLEERLHPCDSTIWNDIGEEQNKKAFEYLNKRGVKEVMSIYSLLVVEKLFGLTLDFDEGKTWYRYEGVYDENYWVERFREEGIELKVYDNLNKETLQ